MTYQIRLKEFEGPLELLLNLIEEQKLSINEVSLAGVTQEYLTYLNQLKEKESEVYPHTYHIGVGVYHKEIASFLVVAATLMVIKSRSLLPGFYVSEEETADIKELEDRLRTYKIIKLMAQKIGKISENRRELFTRSGFEETPAAFLPPKNGLDPQKMLGLLRGLIMAIPKVHELPQKIVKKIISLEEKIKELQKRIEAVVVKTFRDFVGGEREKLHIIVSFLAMLELTKIGVIAVRQSEQFGLIHIDHGIGKNS